MITITVILIYVWYDSLRDYQLNVSWVVIHDSAIEHVMNTTAADLLALFL
jgi:hypothetical protein